MGDVRRQEILVPGEGIEPTWCRHRGILSPVRLPIPPSRRGSARGRAGEERICAPIIASARGSYNRAVHLSDFDYALPPELIAQHPSAERTASRLLHVH